MKIIILLIGILALLNIAAQGTDINVSLLNQDPDPVEPGDTVDLRFRIENKGGGSIGGLSFELLPTYPFSISESTIKSLSSLDARQLGNDAAVIKFKVLADGNVEEGDYDIFGQYKVGSGAWTRAGPFKVHVKSVEAILSIISTKETQLSAGSKTKLSIGLQNFGKSNLKDTRVKLVLDGAPFAPIGMSNEIILPNINAGEQKNVAFDILADEDAESGIYKTDILLEYLDDSGTKYVRNSSIGLIVYNEPALDIGLEDTNLYLSRSNGEAVVSISNTGPGLIRFITVELEDSPHYKVLSSPKIYVGNLEPDDFETAEFAIHSLSDTPKDFDLQLKLTFRDSLNKEMTIMQSLKHPLYSKKQAMAFGLITTQQNFVLVYIGIAVQIVLLVFVIFMLVDCWKNNLPRYKKVLWTVLILTGIGAVLYYFIARRRR